MLFDFFSVLLESIATILNKRIDSDNSMEGKKNEKKYAARIIYKQINR